MRAFRGYGLHKGLRLLVEMFWESMPQRVKAPYTKMKAAWQYPEYRETRGTLREVRGTTPLG